MCHPSKNDKVIIKTPKINYSEEEYISSLFAKNDHVPILKILSDINHLTNFTNVFVHHNVKNVKMDPTQETIFAGLIDPGHTIVQLTKTVIPLIVIFLIIAAKKLLLSFLEMQYYLAANQLLLTLIKVALILRH